MPGSPFVRDPRSAAAVELAARVSELARQAQIKAVGAKAAADEALRYTAYRLAKLRRAAR
jgi:hypothetical protein